MDLWCVHAQGNGFHLRSSFPDKPMWGTSRNQLIGLEIRVPRKGSLPGYSRHRTVLVGATGKKNSGGTPGDSSSNSSSSSSGKSDGLEGRGDDLKGDNSPPGSNKSGDTSSQKSHQKPLDWREFRALLFQKEKWFQADIADSVHNQEATSPSLKALPRKWAHPISAPENGCLLVATEKLDGVRTFERTVVLLLRSGTRNPTEGPFGIVINRPLHKNTRHMSPSNTELATTFAECSLHFGGPLEASMFLLRAGEASELTGFEGVIPGIYFGSRNNLDEAAAQVKKGVLRPQDFKFFIGYAGWMVDQLAEEIESGYWYVAACSGNLIAGASQNSCADGLWGEILQLMGGHYADLSRKPKQDL